jgi:hypothetical protein
MVIPVFPFRGGRYEEGFVGFSQSFLEETGKEVTSSGS